MNYKDSGVDIDAANEFVEKIKERVPTIGGFSGMMRVPEGYDKPILVSGADGVGTKLNIARILNNHKTIGVDLVAMCVNDVITSGAKPLYFLDYIATGKINQDILGDVLDGILLGCLKSEMELLGGETAEMPRIYNGDDYDLAGFCTGVVEEFDVVDGKNIREGDKIIGIASSGLHSNGYSLINKLIFHQALFVADTPELITPTRIYAPTIKILLDEVPVLGMAHITGGGLPENLPRCLPWGLNADVDYDSWEVPRIFGKIQKAGNVSDEEMRNVFNMGVGYCVIVPEHSVDDTLNLIDLDAWVIGTVR